MHKPSLLIIGGDSTLGSSIASNHAFNSLFSITSTTRKERKKMGNSIFIDLEDPQSFLNIKKRYDASILLSSITDTAYCSKHPLISQQINVFATNQLLYYLNSLGIYCIFISTSMVFDGSSIRIPKEMPINPKTEYGNQKARVEAEIHKDFPNYSILRLSKVVSTSFPLFCNWLNALIAGENIIAFDDWYFSPLMINDVHAFILSLLKYKSSGLFQLSPKDQISYFESAICLSKIIKSSQKQIVPASIENSKFKPEWNPSFTSLESDLDVKSSKIAINEIFNKLVINA